MPIPDSTVESYIRNIEKLRAQNDDLLSALYFLAADVEAMHRSHANLRPPITKNETDNLLRAQALLKGFEPELT